MMQFDRRFRSVALAVVMVGALALPAAAQTLTMGAGAPSTSLDPHFFNAAPNSSVAAHIFSRLVERDAQVRPQPGLAESWRAISATYSACTGLSVGVR